MPFDTTEIGNLADDLLAARNKITRETVAVVSKGALNIKRQMVADLRESKSFRSIAPSVSYDTTVRAGTVEAEIGPDKDKVFGSNGAQAGPLANIAYFGTSRGGGTVRDPQTALDEEEPRFLDAMAKIGDDIL